MTLRLTASYFTDPETGERVELPSHRVICGTCNGEGTHVHRGVDCGGITAAERRADWWVDDPEALT